MKAMKQAAKLVPVWLALGCVVPLEDINPTTEASGHTVTSLSSGNTTNVVNVSGQSDTITHTVTLVSPAATILDVSFAVYPPFLGVSPQSCIVTSPTTGTRTNGTWSCDTVIPNGAAQGDWPVVIYVRDDTFASDVIVASELQSDSQDYQIVVNGDDFSPPDITGFTRTAIGQADPGVVDLEVGNRVQSAITATDNGGIQDTSATWISPAGVPSTCIATTGGDDIYSCNITVAETGTWTLQSLTARDPTGQTTTLVQSEAATAGWPTSFSVVDSSPVCGNAIVEPPDEECEAGVALSDTCLTLGYVGGTLACDEPNCLYDETECVAPGCGNAIVEPGEDCEAGVAITESCTDLGQGFTGGTLACNDPTCLYDTSGCTAPGCDSFTSPFDLTATGNVDPALGWANSTQQSQSAQLLTFTTYAHVTGTGNDIVAIGDKVMAAWSDAHMLVRFDPDGFFDARDGGTYTQDALIPWVAGEWYKITITTDVSLETYTVTIGVCDETPTVLITDAAYRTDAGAVDLNGMDYFAAWADTGEVLDLEQPVWSPTCNPLTCGDYPPVACGSPPDTCGGTLSCGTCTNPDVCNNFQCCTPTTCGALGATCGTPPDGCGGTLASCGSCTGPDVCLGNYTCGTPTNWWEQYTEPNATNTGPNPSSCPSNWAHGGVCPNTSLTNIGSCPTINETYVTNNMMPGRILENFECSGTMRFETTNFTLRNFKVTAGSFWGIRVPDGTTVNSVLLEFGEVVGPTDNCITGRGFTGRYLHIHNCDDTQKVGGLNHGPLVVEHSYYHTVTGGHGDTFQVYPDMDSSVTVKYSSLECGATTSCLITTQAVSDPILFEKNWVYGNGSAGVFRCKYDAEDCCSKVPPGAFGNAAITVRDTLADRDWRVWAWGDVGTSKEDCAMCNNRYMDDLSHMEFPMNQEGTECPP